MGASSSSLTVVPEIFPLPVYYDFASTLCCVAHRVLGRLEPRIVDLGVELEWRPVDLTLLTGWRRGAPVRGAGRVHALRVAEELGVPVRMPAFWLDSRPAHAVALALRDQSAKEAVWRERIWTAVHEEGCDIGEEAVLERLSREVGLEGVARDTVVVEEVSLAAHEQGVQAVPTFLIDDWPMGGIQDDRTMVALFERYVRKRQREAAGRADSEGSSH